MAITQRFRSNLRRRLESCQQSVTSYLLTTVRDSDGNVLDGVRLHHHLFGTIPRSYNYSPQLSALLPRRVDQVVEDRHGRLPEGTVLAGRDRIVVVDDMPRAKAFHIPVVDTKRPGSANDLRTMFVLGCSAMVIRVPFLVEYPGYGSSDHTSGIISIATKRLPSPDQLVAKIGEPHLGPDVIAPAISEVYGPDTLAQLLRISHIYRTIDDLPFRVLSYALDKVCSPGALFKMLPPLSTLCQPLSSAVDHVSVTRNATPPDPTLLQDLSLLATLFSSIKS